MLKKPFSAKKRLKNTTIITRENDSHINNFGMVHKNLLLMKVMILLALSCQSPCANTWSRFL